MMLVLSVCHGLGWFMMKITVMFTMVFCSSLLDFLSRSVMPIKMSVTVCDFSLKFPSRSVGVRMTGPNFCLYTSTFPFSSCFTKGVQFNWIYFIKTIPSQFNSIQLNYQIWFICNTSTCWFLRQLRILGLRDKRWICENFLTRREKTLIWSISFSSFNSIHVLIRIQLYWSFFKLICPTLKLLLTTKFHVFHPLISSKFLSRSSW
jgi:hypothetical protein